MIRSSRSLDLSLHCITRMRDKVGRPPKGNSAIKLYRYATSQPGPVIILSKGMEKCNEH